MEPNVGEGATMKKDYVFTKDAVKLLTNRFGLDLSENDKRRIHSIEDALIDAVRPCLPDYLITVIDEATIPTTDSRAVYLDDVHFGRPEETISLTRTLPFEDLGNRFDSERIMQRAGSQELEHQARRLRHDSYAVVDVGIFSGKTMLEQLELLKRQGITIDCLIVALAGKEALSQKDGKHYLIDARTRMPTNIEVKVQKGRIFDWGEWIEVRDLIGLDGRSLKSAGRTYECYSTRLKEQASIPEQYCGHVAELAKQAFEKIQGIVRPYGLEWQDSKVEQAGKQYELRTVVMNKKIMEAP